MFRIDSVTRDTFELCNINNYYVSQSKNIWSSLFFQDCRVLFDKSFYVVNLFNTKKNKSEGKPL